MRMGLGKEVGGPGSGLGQRDWEYGGTGVGGEVVGGWGGAGGDGGLGCW